MIKKYCVPRLRNVSSILSDRRFPALLISVITFLLYLPALKSELLLWDDTFYVINNSHIRSLDPGFFKWAFTDLATGFWYPLTWISYAVDYAVWGLNPFGFHLTAIILHAINTYLVIHLACKLLGAAIVIKSGSGAKSFLDERGISIAGCVTGVLFGIHPLHVESVAWVSERKDLLCALFYLWSLIYYLDYVTGRKQETVHAAREMLCFNRQYLLTFIMFNCALASKTMAITLPIVLLILDYYPLERMKCWKDLFARVTEKAPFFAFSLLNAVISFVAEKNLGAFKSAEVYTVGERMLTATRALAMYLWKMVVPLHLIPFYPYPETISLFAREYLLSVLCIICLSALSVLAVRRNKMPITAWSYYVFTLLPVAGLVPLGAFSIADRYTYLPSLGPFLLAGIAAAWLWKRIASAEGKASLTRGVVILVAAAYLVFLSVLLVRQLKVWNNSIALWSQVIEKGPYEDPLAYSVRGLAHLEAGNYEQAISDCNKSIMIKPYNPQSFLYRARTYMALGRLDLSMQDLHRAIAFDNKYADAYSVRGQVHEAGGDLESAIADYTAAVSINPELYEVYLYRGIAFKKLGQYTRAIDDYNRALAFLPASPEVYNSRGAANRYLGRLDLAIMDYSKAISIDPKFSLAYCNRGIVYKEQKNYEKAIEDFRHAKSLEPDLIKAYMELAECYLATGRADLAREEYAQACSRKSAEGCKSLQGFK